MAKKFTSLVLALIMCLSLCVPTLALNNQQNGDDLEVVDSLGNKMRSTFEIYDGAYHICVFVNDVLTQQAITNIETGEGVLNLFDASSRSSSDEIHYNLSDYVKEIPVSPTSEIIPSETYSITGRYRTDYTYQGSILYGDTKTAAYETGGRYYGRVLNFSAGDVVALVLSALAGYFTGDGKVTIATLGALGIPVVGGKIVDHFTKEVYYTNFKVATRVYFDGIYTANVYQMYDKVLVSIDAVVDEQGGKSTHYADDYYGYDIVASFSRYAATASSLAFYEKYGIGTNPDLKLPITSIPYTG